MIEKEVLGCFLQDNSLILETSIRPTYFEKQQYQLLFQSMLKLTHEGKAVDRVSLLSDNYDYISQMGGPAFITELENEGKVENFALVFEFCYKCRPTQLRNVIIVIRQ